MTPREYDVLTFVKVHISRHGFGPSLGQIAAAVGLKSKSGVHRMVKSLCDQKLLKKGGRTKSRNLSLPEPAADPAPVSASTTRLDWMPDFILLAECARRGLVAGIQTSQSSK